MKNYSLYNITGQIRKKLFSSESLLVRIFNDPQPIPRKVPDYMRKKGGILYWTGALIMITFIYEIITGLVILIYYEPSNPYVSTESFINSVPFGSLILTTHLYAAYAMIFLIYVHLLRNLFVGAYKKPREIQWITGIVLLVMTIGLSFFGYSMSGDALAADAVGVGQTIAGGTPSIGTYVRTIFFGTGTSLTLFQSMLAWHIILAAGVGILFAIHFFIAEFNTIMPSRKEAKYRAPALDTDPGTYKPWFPYNLMYMMQYLVIVFGAVILIPSLLAISPGIPPLFSPFPQAAAGAALPPGFPSYPPWFLLFVYKELDFTIVTNLTPFWSTVIFVGAPLLYLLLIPFIDRKPTLSMVDRPLTVALAITGTIYLIGLSTWGALSPHIQEHTPEVLAFFIIPAAAAILLSYYTAGMVREGRMDVRTEIPLMVLLAMTGLTAFILGLSISTVMASVTGSSLAALVLMATAVAVEVSIAMGVIYGIIPDGKPLEIPWIKKFPVSAVLGFGAFGILIFISFLPVGSVYNQSLYGIGLGIIFILAGMMIRVYRKEAYGE